MSVRGYNILPVGVNLVTDLRASDPAPGTVIQVFPKDQAPSGNTNQQWRVEPVPAGTNLFTIQNISTGTYAGFNGIPATNTGVAGYPVSTVWELVTLDNSNIGNFTIQVPNTNLVWTGSNKSGIQITLTLSSGSPTQKWSFVYV